MTQYETLDRLIIDRLTGNKGVSLISLGSGARAIESERIATLTGRESFRVIDARLQALKKKGLIRFSGFGSSRGWELTV